MNRTLPGDDQVFLPPHGAGQMACTYQ